jgi:uncharacterized protein YecE (DUF72 family)
MPTEKIVDGWNRATPERYALTLKAPRRITHDARLKNCADRVQQFLEAAASLGGKLGALLFQLPPNLKKDVALLESFLDAFPPRVRAAFEFRHRSWFDDAVYESLRRRGMALCIADSVKLSTPLVATGTFGYYRLRDEGYTPEHIAQWAEAVRNDAAGGREVFVYFKHEEEGKGPEFARMLMDRLGISVPESHAP